MNIGNNTKLLVGFMLLAISSISLAGIGGFLSKDKNENSGQDPVAIQEKVVQQYLVASEHITSSQLLLAQALGMENEISLLKAEQDALKSGSVESKDSLERQTTVMANVNNAIQEKISTGQSLDEKGKKQMAAGLVMYMSGLYETKKMLDEGKEFAASSKDALSAASFMEKGKLAKKLAAGTYLMKEMPKHAKSLYSSSSSLLAYARDNDIETPDDATSEISFN